MTLPLLKRLIVLFLALAVLGAASLVAFDFTKLRPSNKKFTRKQPVAVAGVRGMDEPGEEGDTDARDDEALAWLESQTVSEKELGAFMGQGGLKQ